MQDCATFSFDSRSTPETEALARQLSALVAPPATLLLEGEIGAGKSLFARAFIRARGVTEHDIPSPTFTLVQTYEGDDAVLWHVDLYRLSDIAEVEELGLFDAFESDICLVEWPDRLGAEAPQGALHLRFEMGDTPNQRSIRVTGPAGIVGALTP